MRGYLFYLTTIACAAVLYLVWTNTISTTRLIITGHVTAGDVFLAIAISAILTALTAFFAIIATIAHLIRRRIVWAFISFVLAVVGAVMTVYFFLQLPGTAL
jgi:hypothetical protein